MNQYQEHIKQFSFQELQVCEQIARAFNIDTEEMFIQKRHRPLCEARYMFIYWLKKNLRYSLKQIGMLGKYNGYDHTTVLHAINTMQDLLFTDDHMKGIWSSLPVVLCVEPYPQITALKFRP